MIWVRKKTTQRSAIISAVMMIIVFIAAPAAQALTLIPPSLELGLIPGESLKTSVKLYNETQETLELYTEPANFSATGETGQPTFDFSTQREDLSAWMQVESGPIVLKPGDRYEVPVTIATPAGADPGGHYASLFFSTTPPTDGVGQVRIASKVGTLFLTQVEGDITESGSINQFGTTGAQKMFNRPPVDFFVRFQNAGNVHLKPTGTVTVTNMFGKKVDTIEFNAAKGATLPNTIRKYDVVWEKNKVAALNGNFFKRFWQEYGNEKDNFGFGKYTATLAVTAGSVSDSSSLTFWLFPWHVIVVWIVIAIILVLLLIFLIKRYNAWILKKAQK